MAPVTAVKKKFVDLPVANENNVLLIVRVKDVSDIPGKDLSSRYRWSARDQPPRGRV